jgi:CheY-like chemotaxis protein
MPHKLKILVIDDSKEDQFLLDRAIRKAGVALNPRFVTDGEEAIAYLEGEGKFGDREEFPLPSLIILDLKMPRMNGFDVLKWVKAQPRHVCTPVVIFTSSDESKDVNRAYMLGASSYIPKPTDSDRFAGVVQAIEDYWQGNCKLPDRHN